MGSQGGGTVPVGLRCTKAQRRKLRRIAREQRLEGAGSVFRTMSLQEAMAYYDERYG